jgi:hypothetical protein
MAVPPVPGRIRSSVEGVSARNVGGRGARDASRSMRHVHFRATINPIATGTIPISAATW